jgi:hypothetical protein
MSINRFSNATGLSKLTLTAISLCGLAVSTPAQNRSLPEMAPERGFTIPSKVQTPIVLQTQPDAVCDLHAEGVSDAAQSLRLYADGEGYVRVHVSSKYESQTDERVQLDCTSGGKVTTYPLHLRAGAAPTEDMPAPQTSVPEPKGARVVPALKDEDARQLSDQDLLSRGYPRRPDAVTSPEHYKTWLDMVSRPLTLVPPHSVSRSDVSHRLRNAQAGTTSYTSGNWSGYEAHATKGTYNGVQGEWNVPGIVFGEPGNVTWSAFWVGLDGDNTTDLIQAGTEQNYTEIGSLSYANYYVWTELLPNQPFEQVVSLQVNPGDDIFVQVLAPAGLPNGCFLLWNKTQGHFAGPCTPLNGTQVGGSEAEWIMERPLVGGTFAELSAYVLATMTNAYALSATGGGAIPSGTAANEQITMYNRDNNHHEDNNVLSVVIPVPPDTMFFNWVNFH